MKVRAAPPFRLRFCKLASSKGTGAHDAMADNGGVESYWAH